MIEAATVPLMQRPGVRQFVKFCIVGASSFAIDFGISFILHFYFNINLKVAKTLSFAIAVTNGFIWNNKWTFQNSGTKAAHEKYAKFAAVNVVGWVLNLGIVTTVVAAETGSWTNQQPSKMVFLIATLVATGVVVIWNFFANKHWTFKH